MPQIGATIEQMSTLSQKFSTEADDVSRCAARSPRSSPPPGGKAPPHSASRANGKAATPPCSTACRHRSRNAPPRCATAPPPSRPRAASPRAEAEDRPMSSELQAAIRQALGPSASSLTDGVLRAAADGISRAVGSFPIGDPPAMRSAAVRLHDIALRTRQEADRMNAAIERCGSWIGPARERIRDPDQR